jgi:hypothetical protein
MTSRPNPPDVHELHPTSLRTRLLLGVAIGVGSSVGIATHAIAQDATTPTPTETADTESDLTLGSSSKVRILAGRPTDFWLEGDGADSVTNAIFEFTNGSGSAEPVESPGPGSAADPAATYTFDTTGAAVPVKVTVERDGETTTFETTLEVISLDTINQEIEPPDPGARGTNRQLTEIGGTDDVEGGPGGAPNSTPGEDGDATTASPVDDLPPPPSEVDVPQSTGASGPVDPSGLDGDPTDVPEDSPQNTSQQAPSDDNSAAPNLALLATPFVPGQRRELEIVDESGAPIEPFPRDEGGTLVTSSSLETDGDVLVAASAEGENVDDSSNDIVPGIPGNGLTGSEWLDRIGGRQVWDNAIGELFELWNAKGYSAKVKISAEYASYTFGFQRGPTGDVFITVGVSASTKSSNGGFSPQVKPIDKNPAFVEFPLSIGSGDFKTEVKPVIGEPNYGIKIQVKGVAPYRTLEIKVPKSFLPWDYEYTWIVDPAGYDMELDPIDEKFDLSGGLTINLPVSVLQDLIPDFPIDLDFFKNLLNRAQEQLDDEPPAPPLSSLPIDSETVIVAMRESKNGLGIKDFTKFGQKFDGVSYNLLREQGVEIDVSYSLAVDSGIRFDGADFRAIAEDFDLTDYTFEDFANQNVSFSKLEDLDRELDLTGVSALDIANAGVEGGYTLGETANTGISFEGVSPAQLDEWVRFDGTDLATFDRYKFDLAGTSYQDLVDRGANFDGLTFEQITDQNRGLTLSGTSFDTLADNNTDFGGTSYTELTGKGLSFTGKTWSDVAGRDDIDLAGVPFSTLAADLDFSNVIPASLTAKGVDISGAGFEELSDAGVMLLPDPVVIIDNPFRDDPGIMFDESDDPNYDDPLRDDPLIDGDDGEPFDDPATDNSALNDDLYATSPTDNDPFDNDPLGLERNKREDIFGDDLYEDLAESDPYYSDKPKPSGLDEPQIREDLFPDARDELEASDPNSLPGGSGGGSGGGIK